jgi:hypothetical protein
MPAINKKSILIVGFVLIIILAVGASNRPEQEITDESDSQEQQKEAEEKDLVSFTEGDLNSLGKSIEGLEFDDLGGLALDDSVDLSENSTDIELSELELDKLGELLQGLEFDDLGGLTEE